ncbi:glycosyltransferase [Haloferula sargassicola]|uniref:Glycosyltransferase 2-like domain-containing protein n=1 Tax=Haloferula sargassicola TaxID=490096 RepID=A0ABP9UQ33_9BACT
MKIAAVFATMNRRDTAETCLRRLAGQTRPPDLVVVADNASTDGTLEALKSLPALSFPLEILELGENRGNAGGIEAAMERAFDLGSEAVWILDDDSWPEPDALERLLDPAGPAEGIRSSLVVDPATGRPSWPFQVMIGGDWSLVTEVPAGSDWLRVRRSWLGVLVPRGLRDRIGPVLGDLFLRGEDEDYPRRIEAAGVAVHLATRSVLHHPPGGRLHHGRFFGRTVALEADLPAAKLYYRLRNSWWLTRRDQGLPAAAVLVACHGWLLLRHQRPLGEGLHGAARALADAFRDRLGRRDDL